MAKEERRAYRVKREERRESRKKIVKE